tara:strand:- start:36 stop:314 length:279 start_codon:yes stop_codon:yes gene_type:complete
MTVYVDNNKAKFKRMIMCHMAADTREELFAMVDAIGVQRKWIQCKDTYKEHFDISSGKRDLAVSFGAVEVSRKDLARWMQRRKTLREKVRHG